MKSKTSFKSLNYLCAIALAFFCYAFCSVGCQFEAESGSRESPGLKNKEEQQQPKVIQIYALGRLEPASRVRKISAPFGTQGVRVEKLFVQEGDEVDEGAILARLDNATQLQAELDQAQSQVSVTEAKLIQIEAGAKLADIKSKELAADGFKLEMEKNKKKLQRIQQLRDKNVVTQEELEERTWEYEQTRLNYEQARANWESIKEVRETDVAVAREEVYSARSNLEKKRADLLHADIKAPIKGRILRIHTLAGEKLGDNALLEMGNVEEMHAVAEVYEADLNKLKIGMPAKVYVSSLQQTLSGSVCELGQLVARKDVLSNDPVSDTDARVVEVRIKLDAESTPLVQRLSQARVEVSMDLSSTEESTNTKAISPQVTKQR
jgi:HlyD family secretion protein